MTFGEKLKTLRTDNQLTQDALAEKLFVSRTAVSKWETDKGFPDIDNLKNISDLFGVSIDDLISNDDVRTQRLLMQKQARRMYWLAIVCLAAATMFALLTYFLHLPQLGIGSGVCSIGYLVFGLLSKPKYKRMEAKRLLVPYILSRLVILLVIAVVVIAAFHT